MDPIKVAENVYWVGAIDWNVRDFHGYSTAEGTTYNAYLILDDKIALIDFVKGPFVKELLQGIHALVDPKDIDIVISNHTESDHSGALPHVMHAVGKEKPLYCSVMGAKNLPMHYGNEYNYRVVQDGETLSLGKRTLTFLETRMLHWPDSMFTYVNEDKILFSSDAFGQHYAGLERFDDEIGDAIMPHALKYFANILTPYSPLILKLVERVQKLGVEFSIICPDHGIIWRTDPGKIIQSYVDWSLQKPCQRAVVLYDTMWGSTRTMAETITETLGQEGVDARSMHLRACHRSDVMTHVHQAGTVVVGSPTLNQGLFPTVADFLAYMKGLRPANKIGAAFGSYGWSPKADKVILDELKATGMHTVEPALNIQFVPDDEGRRACRAFAKRVADVLKQHIAGS